MWRYDVSLNHFIISLRKPTQNLSSDVSTSHGETELISDAARQHPIVWTGNEGAGAGDGAPDQDAAPAAAVAAIAKKQYDTAVIGRLVQNSLRTHGRLVSQQAGGAASQEIARAAGAGARLQLERAQARGPEMVRKAALSLAEQQRRAACIGLLKEVARSYGYTCVLVSLEVFTFFVDRHF